MKELIDLGLTMAYNRCDQLQPLRVGYRHALLRSTMLRRQRHRQEELAFVANITELLDAGESYLPVCSDAEHEMETLRQVTELHVNCDSFNRLVGADEPDYGGEG